MPGTFIFSFVTAVVTLLLAAAWRVAGAKAKALEAKPQRGRYDDEAIETAHFVRIGSKVGTFAAAGLTGLLVLVSSFNTVGTQNIGIVTSFGKPVGHVGNGAVWVAPWEQVTDMDEAIQVSDYEGGNCLTVRIADQQTACVNAKVRWRILPGDADSLFRNYKNSTAGVENGLLTPEIQNVANTVFDGYDPVGLLNSSIPQGRPGNPTVPQLGQQVEQQLAAKISAQVEIVSLFMPNIQYDSTVQARLNAVLSQKAETLVAQQQEQTANAQAAANRSLQASVSNDPNVLVSKCLDLLGQMLKQNMTPPAGFSCWPGGSSVGVIASAAK